MSLANDDRKTHPDRAAAEGTCYYEFERVTKKSVPPGKRHLPRAFPMRPLIALLMFALPAVAAPVPKALKKPQNPDGGWLVVAFSQDGAELAEPKSMVREWHIAGEHRSNGSVLEPAHHAKGTPNFTVIDPDKPHLRKWGTMPAVFEVDGDTLRACYAHDGRTELTECKPQMGVHYYVFTRAKGEK